MRTPSQEAYRATRQEKVDTIDKFILHLEGTKVECTNSEPFQVCRETTWSSNTTLGLDVYDLVEGDKVRIRGVTGVITKVETVPGRRDLCTTL